MAVRMWGGTEVKGTSLEFMEWKQPYSTFLSENGTCVQTLKKGDKKYGSPDSKGRLTSAKPSCFHDW